MVKNATDDYTQDIFQNDFRRRRVRFYIFSKHYFLGVLLVDKGKGINHRNES